MEASVEVPPYFLCPISLEIMRDPVTLATGISYDRDSIERWVFSNGHATCPVTKQPLAAGDREPTPNHTLRRLIQAWCGLHADDGVDRIPTPRAPVDRARVAALFDEAGLGGAQKEAAALRELRAVVAESDRNRRLVEDHPGAVDFLLSVVKKHVAKPHYCQEHQEDEEVGLYGVVLDSPSTSSGEEEALSILHSLKLSEQSRARMVEANPDLFDTVTAVLRRPSYRSRTYGILLLKAAVSAAAPARLTSVSAELVREVTKVVTDRVSAKAVKAALHVVCRLSPWGRNRVKAVHAGVVQAAVELLLDAPGRKACELALAAVEHACGCADGRAELVAHPAGLAVVAKKVLRVSAAANESAVRALHLVAKHSAAPAVVQEMAQVGVVAKLCFLVQMGPGEPGRERAMEVLRLHARVWRNSPCLTPQLKASYPSS